MGAESIRLTRALHTKVPSAALLLPLGLQTKAKWIMWGMRCATWRSEATKAGVTLGLEVTIAAEDNVRIMERSRSANVLVYYDIGNRHRPDSIR